MIVFHISVYDSVICYTVSGLQSEAAFQKRYKKYINSIIFLLSLSYLLLQYRMKFAKHDLNFILIANHNLISAFYLISY